MRSWPFPVSCSGAGRSGLGCRARWVPAVCDVRPEVQGSPKLKVCKFRPVVSSRWGSSMGMPTFHMSPHLSQSTLTTNLLAGLTPQGSPSGDLVPGGSLGSISFPSFVSWKKESQSQCVGKSVLNLVACVLRTSGKLKDLVVEAGHLKRDRILGAPGWLSWAFGFRSGHDLVCGFRPHMGLLC